MVMKKYLCLLALLSVFATVSCGKLAAPEPVPGSGYPHTYPRN